MPRESYPYFTGEHLPGYDQQFAGQYKSEDLWYQPAFQYKPVELVAQPPVHYAPAQVIVKEAPKPASYGAVRGTTHVDAREYGPEPKPPSLKDVQLPDPDEVRAARPIPGPPRGRKASLPPAAVRADAAGPSKPVTTSKVETVNLNTQKSKEFAAMHAYINERLTRANNRRVPEDFNGFKILKNSKLPLNGDKVKMTHSFVCMYDAKSNSVVPYMLSHGKEENIPYNLKGIEKKGYLGKGAFGRVKIAERLERQADGTLAPEKVAIKVLKKSPDASELECLKVMGQYDLDTFNDRNKKTYLSLKFLPGEELTVKNRDKYKPNDTFYAGVLKSSGYSGLVREVRDRSSSLWHNEAVSVKDKVSVAEQLASQLSHMHSKGYAHLDLKGENIRYNPETNTANVIDFGLARKIGRSQLKAGTPYYLSPEIAAMIDGKRKPGPITGKEDVYTLGIIFSKELQLHRDPSCGKELCKLILRMTEDDPASRPTMTEVALEIKSIKCHAEQKAKAKAAAAAPGSDLPLPGVMRFISTGGIGTGDDAGYEPSDAPVPAGHGHR